MKYRKTLGIFTVKKISFYKNKYYTYGGFGSYLSEIRNYFSKTILVAHVANKKPAKGYYEIPKKNLEIVHLKQGRNELEHLLQLPINFYIASKRIKSMDVVHCRVPDYTGIIGVLLSRFHKKQYFIQTIADWYIEAQKTSILKKYGLGLLLKIHYYIYDFLERVIAKNNLIFAQGTSSYEKHKNNSHAMIISSSAHYNKDIGTIKQRFVSEKNVNVLHVGRLTGIKNQNLIIEVIHKLNNNSDLVWNLKILGEGPLRVSLQKKIDSLGQSENITLVGQVDRGKSFWNYFDESDIFLMASKSEGTPKVILESMARSVPVVAPSVGGIPFLVENNVRGLLYKEGGLEEFYNAIMEIKNNKVVRNKIIENAFEFSKINTVEQSTEFMINKVSKYFKWKEE